MAMVSEWSPNFGAIADTVNEARRAQVREAWERSCTIESVLDTVWAYTTNARVVCVLLGLEPTNENVIAVLRDVQLDFDSDTIEHEITQLEIMQLRDGVRR